VGCPQDDTLQCLFLRSQEGLGGVEELDARNFCCHMYALEAAFRSAIASESQKILVAEVRRQFVEVRLEGNGFSDPEIVGLGSGRFGEAA
jgi:hypothetical protein